MVGRLLLAVGGGARRVIVAALPSWGAVRGLSGRLFALGLLFAGVGLESIVDVARVGTAATGPVFPGYAAIGFTCIALAALVPVAYLTVVFATATGSLVGRRVVAIGRAVSALGRQRDGPQRRTRPR